MELEDIFKSGLQGRIRVTNGFHTNHEPSRQHGSLKSVSEVGTKELHFGNPFRSYVLYNVEHLFLESHWTAIEGVNDV